MAKGKSCSGSKKSMGKGKKVKAAVAKKLPKKMAAKAIKKRMMK